MAEYLFSYGTLQTQKTQRLLFGRVLQQWSDVLSGYRLQTIEIYDEAFLARGDAKEQRTVVPSGNDKDCIEGSVLELTTEELLVVDQYEPAGYKRIKVVLQSGREAWIYCRV